MLLEVASGNYSVERRNEMSILLARARVSNMCGLLFIVMYFKIHI